MINNGKMDSPPLEPSFDELPDDVSRKEFLLTTLNRYECRLTAYATRLLGGDLERARDVVQNAFLKLCEQPFAEIRPKVAAWLYTVVRNRITDDRRLASASNQSLDFECLDRNGRDPADDAERVEFLSRLRSLMDQLPEAQREVIDLWSHGLQTSEIADVMQVATGTVRVNLHRGFKTLRSQAEVAEWLNESDAGDDDSSHRFQGTINPGSVTKPERATGFDTRPQNGDFDLTSESFESSKLNGKPGPEVPSGSNASAVSEPTSHSRTSISGKTS